MPTVEQVMTAIREAVEDAAGVPRGTFHRSTAGAAGHAPAAGAGPIGRGRGRLGPRADWSAEQIRRARNLRRAGYGPTAIAAEVSRHGPPRTPQAVSNKLHRLDRSAACAERRSGGGPASHDASQGKD